MGTMAERRWVAPTACAMVLAIVAGLVGFALGSSGETEGGTPAAQAAGGLIARVDGIPVGIANTRAGAAAAADNYVAIATETIVQDPQRYDQLVRTAYVPGYQEQALEEGVRIRETSAEAIAEFGAGGKLVAASVARQVNAFEPGMALVTTWTMGIGWGPRSEPTQFWGLNETQLRWDGQRWLVMQLEPADRPAPAPASVVAEGEEKRTDTFERELEGFSAPQYGG